MDKKHEHYLRQLNRESEKIFSRGVVTERPNEELKARIQHAAKNIKDDNPRLSDALMKHSESAAMNKEKQILSDKARDQIDQLQTNVIRGAIERGELNKVKDDKWLKMHREGTGKL